MKEKKKIIQQLKNHYRLIIYNDSSFQTVWATRLNRLKVGFIFVLVALFFILLTVFFIVFTPLKEYIPGYPDKNVRSAILHNAVLTDSLSQEIRIRDQYLQQIQTLIKGDVPQDPLTEEGDSENEKVKPVKIRYYNHDSIFKQDLLDEQINLSLTKNEKSTNSLANIHFFIPLKGMISQHFDAPAEHFGIDITGLPDSRVAAVLDGTVIFADWTVKAGNVIYIQHRHNLISIYKHNSELLKRTGDHVKAGEIIALMGNTGELTTGPHLHFELWQNGLALNPEEYIDF